MANFTMSDELAEKLAENPLQRAVSFKYAATHCYKEIASMQLPFIAGMDSKGIFRCYDMAITMPHLLIAGRIGHGKSNMLNVLISTLLLSKMPSEVRFLLIDPNIVEFQIYEQLKEKYLVSVPDLDECVITDVENSRIALYALLDEMYLRYTKVTDAKVRNIQDYNIKNPDKCLPDIVAIVDEYSKVFQLGCKEIEKTLIALLQLGRGAGIHVILATNKTSILSPTLICNFNQRIAFRFNSKDESKYFLGETGAEGLLCAGEILLYDGNESHRLRAPFIDINEIGQVVQHADNITENCIPYFLPKPEVPLPQPEPLDSLLHQAAMYICTVKCF